MSRRIEIPIGLDTSEMRKGARDGERALDDLEDAVADAGRGGARDLDDLEDELKDVQRQTERTADSADDIGDDMRRGFDRAGEGAEDFKQEANQSAREAAASFDGSAESIGEVFQEVAANAFGGFGPAGAAAGLAAAAGIGLAIQGFANVGEATEESKQRAAEWADAYIQSSNLIISSAQVAAGVQDIATDPERYAEAKKAAEDWGITTDIAMRALAGDENAINITAESLRRLQEEYDNTGAKVEAVGQQYAEGNITLQERDARIKELNTREAELSRQLNAGRDAFAQLNSEMAVGREAAGNVSQSLLSLIEDAENATVEVDELGNKVYTLPGGHEILVDAKTGKATEDLSRFKGDVDEIPEHLQTNVAVKAHLDSSEVDYWRPSTKYQPVVAVYYDNGKPVLP